MLQIFSPCLSCFSFACDIFVIKEIFSFLYRLYQCFLWFLLCIFNLICVFFKVLCAPRLDLYYLVFPQYANLLFLMFRPLIDLKFIIESHEIGIWLFSSPENGSPLLPVCLQLWRSPSLADLALWELTLAAHPCALLSPGFQLGSGYRRHTKGTERQGERRAHPTLPRWIFAERIAAAPLRFWWCSQPLPADPSTLGLAI